MVRTRGAAFFLIQKGGNSQNKGSVKFLVEKLKKNWSKCIFAKPFKKLPLQYTFDNKKSTIQNYVKTFTKPGPI